MSSGVFSQGHARPIVAGVLMTVLLLSGCGGGGSSLSPTTYSVGGSVTGLRSGASVVLQNDGGNSTTVGANGAFTFSVPVESGSGYSVTVATQPNGQACTVSGGSGTVASTDVTSVSVSCSITGYSVGGTVSGLTSGESVVLEDDGGNSTPVSANGTFTFSSDVAIGSGYSVTVTTQPTGQTCSVSDGSGTVSSADITNVSVTCVNNPALAMVAGTSIGPGNADGALTTARFNSPFGVAIDSSGNTYVVDADSDVVRKITAAGAVSIFAGSPGQPGSADGYPPGARFNTPRGIAVDGAGNVYVSDTGNDTIREITPAGLVSTLAGQPGIAGSTNGVGPAAQFSGPQGIATDASGNVYVADSFNNQIREISAGGVVTTLAGQTSCGATDGAVSNAEFCRPFGLATDSAGNVYVADSENDTIRRISAGTVSTLAGTAGQAGSADGTGTAATFSLPSGLTVAASGNIIYVADTGNGTVREVTTGGVVTTLAGTAGVLGYANATGPAAQFRGGQGPAVDSQGNVYLADNNNLTIRRITPAGVVSTFAGVAPQLGDTDGMGQAAQFYAPDGLATDSAGNVYVADTLNCEIRKMTSAGVVTTLAGSPSLCAFPQWGNLNGIGSAAEFAWPNGVAVDGSGNVYVADTYNDEIREVTPAGTVTTFAGTGSNFNSPFGLTIDSAGNLYVADTGNDTIRKITPAGAVSVFAGSTGVAGSQDGTGLAATFSGPQAITIDSGGNLYVADTGNNIIRKITPAGSVSTLAGTAGVIGSVDATGPNAEFNHPTGIAVDGSGNLYVVDAWNYTIRKVTPAGVVTTLVGVAGQTGFTPGALPGVLDAQTAGIAISGSTLYISTYAGIAAVTNLP
jgi:sugar lactone lactonase YvrE